MERGLVRSPGLLTYHVVHKRAALEEDRGIVRELCPVDVLALVARMGAVPDVIVLVDEADIPQPLERRLGLLGV